MRLAQLQAFAAEMQKLAEGEGQPRARDLALILGAGTLGFGTGTLAGMGGGYLADKAYEKVTGRRIPSSALHIAAPLVGAGAGIAYAMYKAKEQEAIRRALESETGPRTGGVPAK